MIGTAFPAFAHVVHTAAIGTVPVNGVWWTLPIEFSFYLVLPLWPVAAAGTRCCCSWAAGDHVSLAAWRRHPHADARFRSASWPPISCGFHGAFGLGCWQVSVCETVALAWLGAAASESGPARSAGLALVLAATYWLLENATNTADNPISICGRRRWYGRCRDPFSPGGGRAHDQSIVCQPFHGVCGGHYSYYIWHFRAQGLSRRMVPALGSMRFLTLLLQCATDIRNFNAFLCSGRSAGNAFPSGEEPCPGR